MKKFCNSENHSLSLSDYQSIFPNRIQNNVELVEIAVEIDTQKDEIQFTDYLDGIKVITNFDMPPYDYLKRLDESNKYNRIFFSLSSNLRRTSHDEDSMVSIAFFKFLKTCSPENNYKNKIFKVSYPFPRDRWVDLESYDLFKKISKSNSLNENDIFSHLYTFTNNGSFDFLNSEELDLSDIDTNRNEIDDYHEKERIVNDAWRLEYNIKKLHYEFVVTALNDVSNDVGRLSVLTAANATKSGLNQSIGFSQFMKFQYVFLSLMVTVIFIFISTKSSENHIKKTSSFFIKNLFFGKRDSLFSKRQIKINDSQQLGNWYWGINSALKNILIDLIVFIFLFSFFFFLYESSSSSLTYLVISSFLFLIYLFRVIQICTQMTIRVCRLEYFSPSISQLFFYNLRLLTSLFSLLTIIIFSFAIEFSSFKYDEDFILLCFLSSGAISILVTVCILFAPRGITTIIFLVLTMPIIVTINLLIVDYLIDNDIISSNYFSYALLYYSLTAFILFIKNKFSRLLKFLLPLILTLPLCLFCALYFDLTEELISYLYEPTLDKENFPYNLQITFFSFGSVCCSLFFAMLLMLYILRSLEDERYEPSNSLGQKLRRLTRKLARNSPYV